MLGHSIGNTHGMKFILGRYVLCSLVVLFCFMINGTDCEFVIVMLFTEREELR